MTPFSYVVSETENDFRIDKLLADMYPHISRTQIQKWITKMYITVNGKTVKPNYKCQSNDEIEGNIPVKKEIPILAEDIALDIIYEDEYILVINKPMGMVVHPTTEHTTGTLVHALLHHCDRLSDIGGAERPGIVHRIDKDTSGLLVIAKDNTSHEFIVNQLVNKKMNRIYEAIVQGVIEHENGMIDAPIGRDPKNRLRMKVVDDGKEAVTHFQVLHRFKDYTHVRCQLVTGRTHQIRVHMDYINYPIVGDPKYSQKRKLKLEGQALFAKKIGLIHPMTEKYMEFEVEQPFYFQNVIKEIEKMA